MLTFHHLFRLTCAAMCLSIAAPVFAQAAPVYDADNMQEADRYVQAPPAPQQESGNAFVPVQPEIAAASEQQPAEQQGNILQTSDAGARIDSLQGEVQSLRGQVEQLTHQLAQLQNQQKAGARVAQADTESPMEQVEKKIAAAPDMRGAVADTAPEDRETPAAAPASPKIAKPLILKSSKKDGSDVKRDQPNVAEEQQIYQTAYNFIKEKRYSDAVTALQSMLKKYPSGQFASNAHYWLGELYGLMGKNDQALNEFRTVVESYADSPRVSDAQLKVGLLLASQLKWAEAKSALRRVINHYPGSASARLAAEQLKQIKIAGH